MQNKKYLLHCLLAIFFIGNIIFFGLWQNAAKGSNELNIAREKYPLIAKRVLLDEWAGATDIITNFLPLRQQIREVVKPYEDSFALYFEYLPTGTSIGINEDSEFTAASLLKVPVVMAYYHKKEIAGYEQDPTVKIQQNELDKHFGELYKKGAGYDINLADAVKLALTESDNTASLILADQISQDDFSYVYEGLDIPLTVKDESPIVTAQQYTSILKSLYFASILSKDDSQKILDILTKTKFNDKLPAGVPEGIPVAHKIGLIDKQIYQDCGIVYVPARPYVLCMISKSDRKTAVTRMSTISKMVYYYVSKVGK
jgi:beta-lactamase class A